MAKNKLVPTPTEVGQMPKQLCGARRQDWLRGWRDLPKQPGDDSNPAFLTGTRDRMREYLLREHGIQRGVIF